MLTGNISIILASGFGQRFGAAMPKQFLKLAGKTVLEHTLDLFERHPGIDEIIVVGSEDGLPLIADIVNRNGYRKVTRLVLGGETRQASSAAGIAAVTGDSHKVLVHDAVRPLVDEHIINRCLEALDEFDAVDTAIPASDTIIRLDEHGIIDGIPDRSVLYMGQTPQAFRSGLLRKAHKLAATAEALKVTDDCGLVLHFGLASVKVVAGSASNIKITWPSDIYLADRLFQLRTTDLPNKPGDLDVSLKGKVVVVFGAGRGIGAAIRDIAASAGAEVVAVSRSSGVDVADEIAVRQTLRDARKKYGRVDAVVMTAGLLRTGLLGGQSYETIDDQLATNLRGAIVVAREAFDVMQKNGGSIALFTSSSYTRGRARTAVYSATKAAIVNLMQGLAEEYLPFGVRINAINPERTATPMRTENFGKEPDGSLLDAETVARVTLLACFSPSTGEVIDVRRQ